MKLNLNLQRRLLRRPVWLAHEWYHGWPKPDLDVSDEEFHCNFCEKPFTCKKDLMKHSKESIKSVKVCSFFIDSKCDFSDDICWFRHNLEEKDKILSKEYECRFCGKTIQTKYNFMKHRKENHRSSVKMWSNLESGKCKFGDNCWYKHTNEMENKHTI